MKKILLIACLFIFSIGLKAQSNIIWQKSFGGTNQDQPNSIAYTFDGGFIAAGYTTSNDGDITENNGNTDYWIIKVNSSGELEWQKSYGGSDYDFANYIIQIKDGGFLVVGKTQSNDKDVIKNHGKVDCWLIKLDIYGNLEWQKSYGGIESDVASVKPDGQ